MSLSQWTALRVLVEKDSYAGAIGEELSSAVRQDIEYGRYNPLPSITGATPAYAYPVTIQQLQLGISNSGSDDNLGGVSGVVAADLPPILCALKGGDVLRIVPCRSNPFAPNS